MKETILRRKSTRVYKKHHLSQSEISEIEKVLDNYEGFKGPFNNSIEISMNIADSMTIEGKKINTYGILRNVSAFIKGKCQNNLEALVDFGYVYEMIVLELTKKGFATCWVGGTFDRKTYPINLKENEILPAILTVGYSKSISLINGMLKVAMSSKRLPIHDIIINYADVVTNFDMIDLLELVRRGPSASNKQPWRMLIKNNMVHFYLKRTPDYPKINLGFDMQILDIGIAMSHLEIGLNSYDIAFNKNVIKDPEIFEEMEYIITYELSK